MKLSTPRLLVCSLLGCLFTLAIGWETPLPQGDGPAGCVAVFNATTRGGGAPVSLKTSSCNLRSSGPEGVEVVRVIDGDTIVVAGDKRVRYVGVDTPEVGDNPEYYGPEATSYNRRLVLGVEVFLERDVSEKDRFGRLLRFVYSDGILVNAELVREGYARAKEYGADRRYTICFALLEQEAREAGRGMWGRK